MAMKLPSFELRCWVNSVEKSRRTMAKLTANNETA
jgi:hypothetical protein